LIFGFVFAGLVTSSVNVKCSGFSLREQSSLWTSYNKRVILKSSFSARAASVEGNFFKLFSVESMEWNMIDFTQGF